MLPLYVIALFMHNITFIFFCLLMCHIFDEVSPYYEDNVIYKYYLRSVLDDVLNQFFGVAILKLSRTDENECKN